MEMRPIEVNRSVIGLFYSRRVKKIVCLIKNSYKKDKNLTEWKYFFEVLVLTNVFFHSIWPLTCTTNL